MNEPGSYTKPHCMPSFDDMLTGFDHAVKLINDLFDNNLVIRLYLDDCYHYRQIQDLVDTIHTLRLITSTPEKSDANQTP